MLSISKNAALVGSASIGGGFGASAAANEPDSGYTASACGALAVYDGVGISRVLVCHTGTPSRL